MQIIHLYLTGSAGTAKIYSFDYDDGKPGLSSREIVMPYTNQALDDIIQELEFKVIEEKETSNEQT